MLQTPFGKQQVVYVDCTGSGEPDINLDTFIQQHVYPYYANTHSDAFCAEIMCAMIKESRRFIKTQCTHQPEDFALVFTGQGTTGAARHFAHLINYDVQGVAYSVFEHLSNSALWETVFPNATFEVFDALENDTSTIDCDHMISTVDRLLQTVGSEGTVLVALTACSNVLGRIQPIQRLVSRLKEYKRYKSDNTCNLIVCVDTAACAPYIPLSSFTNDVDAIFLSPHKFKGGQSTPGVLLFRKNIIRNCTPFFPGGGTIWYKNKKQMNFFVRDIECREEGGTPNIIGIIKTGLLFKRKFKYQSVILKKTKELVLFVDRYFQDRPDLMHDIDMFTSIGRHQHHRLPIYAFRVRDTHPGLFVKILSDKFGIQSRSGVSCCYILAECLCRPSLKEQRMIIHGKGTSKTYGWIRISFSYFQDTNTVLNVLHSVYHLVKNIQKYKNEYVYIPEKNKWKHKYQDVNDTVIPHLVTSVFENVY